MKFTDEMLKTIRGWVAGDAECKNLRAKIDGLKRKKLALLIQARRENKSAFVVLQSEVRTVNRKSGLLSFEERADKITELFKQFNLASYKISRKLVSDCRRLDLAERQAAIAYGKRHSLLTIRYRQNFIRQYNIEQLRKAHRPVKPNASSSPAD